MSAAGKRAHRGRRWAATLTATAVSTYALDAFATASGLLLAASQLLAGVDHGLLVAILVASYVVWGVGLRINLAANWALLEQTGTSTNALSKAAYDLAGLRNWNVRTRGIASAIGYVIIELAKEVPYYAAAFGAALSDSITSQDALIFLTGTNLGAAAYEYALARLTRAYLQHRSRSPRASSARTRLTPAPAGATRPGSHGLRLDPGARRRRARDAASGP